MVFYIFLAFLVLQFTFIIFIHKPTSYLALNSISCLNKGSFLFYSIIFYPLLFYFILFYSVTFCFVLFCSILFYGNIDQGIHHTAPHHGLSTDMGRNFDFLFLTRTLWNDY